MTIFKKQIIFPNQHPTKLKITSNVLCGFWSPRASTKPNNIIIFETQQSKPQIKQTLHNKVINHRISMTNKLSGPLINYPECIRFRFRSSSLQLFHHHLYSIDKGSSTVAAGP